VQCSPDAANLLRARHALRIEAAMFQTGESFYRTVSPHSRCACCSVSAVEGNRPIGFTIAAGAVGTKHHFSLCSAVRQQGEMRQVGVQAPVIEQRTQANRPRKIGVWGARPKGRGRMA